MKRKAKMINKMICNSNILKDEYEEASSNSVELNILGLIHMAFAFIVISWLNLGTFTYVMPYMANYIRWGFYFAWFGLALTRNEKFVKNFFDQCWPLLSFYCYLFLLSLVVEKNLEVYIKSISYLIMVYSIFLYYFDERYRKFQKILVVFLFLDIVVVGINTFIHLQLNPMLARYLATGKETLGTGTFCGIGSYGYFYSLVSIILLLGFLFLNYSKKKFLVLLLIIAFSGLLIQAAFTIAILFMFGFFALLIIIRYTDKYTFIAVALALLGIIILLTFQGTFALIFEQLSDIESIPHAVSVRLKELALFFSGNNISGTDVNARFILYLQSINAFLNNVLTGTILNDTNMYSAGGHSAWLDLLANFGILSIPFFIFLFRAYKYCINRIPLIFRPFVKVYWLYFICLGFVNTLLFANICNIWFLFLPLFISSFFKISEKNAV